MRVSIRMFKKTVPLQENFLLNAYSSLINFFGPGQSGPGLRGLYLKARHDVRIKDFLFVTLIYYGFYAMLSAFLLFVGSRPWWQTALLVLFVGSGSYVFIKWYEKRSSVNEGPGFTPKNLIYLFLATVLQMAAQVAIYWTELHSVSPGISMSQVLTYTGAANFALFVALTPGAIGIRESFLFFTGQLHHISNSIIIAANVVDRAIYLVFLGILFLFVLGLHAKDKLKLSQLKASATEES